MARNDYYTASEMNPEDIEHGFLFGFKNLLDTEDSGDLWIVAPTKHQIESSDFAEGLGDHNTAALAKTGITTVEGRRVRFYTALTLPGSAPKAVVVAIYPDEKLMTKVDGLTGVSDLIVVPFQMDDVQTWVESRGPVDLLSQQPAQTATVTDSTVVAALKSLVGAINRKTGIGHPSDKSRAIDTFRALAEANIPVNANEVRAWLVQNGISSKNADEIAAIAAEPSKFRRPGESTLNPNIVRIWKGETGQ